MIRIFAALLCAIYWGSPLAVCQSAGGEFFQREALFSELKLDRLEDPAGTAQASEENHETTRLESWSILREKKSENLEPERLSWLEKFWLNREKGGLGFNVKGFYPRFTSISTGAGFSPGVRYWRRDLFGTPLEFQSVAAYSVRSYQLYSVQIGKIMKKGTERLIGSFGSGGLSDFVGLDKREEDFYLYGTYRFRSLTQEDFFGPGPDSLEEDRTDFWVKDSMTSITMGYRPRSWLILAGIGGYLNIEIDPGRDGRYPNTQDAFDDESAPGLFDAPEFWFLGGTSVIDLRDRPGNPHRGILLGMEYARVQSRNGKDFDFQKLNFDVRGYLPLGSEQRTLALQMYTSLSMPDPGNRVPFYLQEPIGGPDILRGFSNFRFRDDHLISLSAEYRWEAAPAWELAFFYDAAKVFPDGTSWNLKDLEKGYGFGMRFKLPNSTILRFDIARSREGTHFYLRLGSTSF